MKKYIPLIVLSLFLSFTQSVFAEAGISEAARTEYYRITDNQMFVVLPGGDGGKGADIISVSYYKKNPQWNLLTRFCAAEYITDKPVGWHSFGGAYVQGDYIFSETMIYNFKTGKILADTESTPPEADSSRSIKNMHFELQADSVAGQYKPVLVIPGSEQVQKWKAEQKRMYDEIVTLQHLKVESATKLDAKYISAHFKALDIEGLEGFSCFIIAYIGIQLLICGAVIAAIIALIVWLVRRGKKKK